MFEIDSPFTMVVLIVLIAVGAGVIKNWIKTRGNREADEETQAVRGGDAALTVIAVVAHWSPSSGGSRGRRSTPVTW